MMPQTTIEKADVLRKVSKITAFLQAFAVALLIGLIYLLSGVYQRYYALHDGIRESSLWSVYQLDRETRRLSEVAGDMLAAGDVSERALSILSTRYDILYSRMSLLKKASLDLRLNDTPAIATLVAKIEPAVMSKAIVFDTVSGGRPIDLLTLRTLVADLHTLTGATEELLTATNIKVSSDRADARSALQVHQVRLGIITGFLAMCVGILVVLLRRQLRSVRAAGLEFERMVEELQQSFESAMAGNQAKSQFMATMGHEVRTPLNAILGTAELLDLSDLPARVREGVQTIQRSGQSLLEVLNEILDFAKMESGKIDVSLATVDVSALVSESVSMLRDRAAEKGNIIVTEALESEIGSMVMTDQMRVRQVLLNLLSNAIKFTAEGVVTVSTSIKTSDRQVRLRFDVADTGIGIDEKGKQRLFKAFSQVDPTISRNYGGTGLGLKISKEIVEALGGHIGVSSDKDRGSTFWFEIPVEPADLGVAAPRQLETEHLPPSLRVLLVEDNHVNQQVAAGLLRHLGQSVTVANDGMEALEVLSKQSFDLVLMDMHMPRMDGIEATRQIRAKGLSLPVVALTANASDEDRRLCVAAGMTGFESKPVNKRQLTALISSFASLDTQSANLEGTAAFDEPLAACRDRRREIVAALGEDGYEELLDEFVDDASNILLQVSRSMESGSWNDVDRLLHALKGAAANLGFDELANDAQSSRGGVLDARRLSTMTASINQLQLLRAA
jgi:signal transduction histidine kinase/CheY-like chemotaxis protein